MSSRLTSVAPDHAIASLNAIESGMSLAPQIDRGMSLAADPYGRILAQVDFFGSIGRTMVAHVPARHVATLYTAFGRWFEWLCLVRFLYVVGYIVARALVARRQVG